MPTDLSNNADFPQTRWSMVAALRPGATDEAGAQRALAEICSRCWYPLYAFARRQGMTQQDAEDAVQGFFAMLIESGSLGRADPERGKLRTFILSAFRYFLADEHDRRMTWRRGGRAQTVAFESMDAEERYAAEPMDTQSPEVFFERRWALSMLETGLDKLAAEREAAGQAATMKILRPFLDASQRDQLTYEQAAAELGGTAQNVRVMVFRLRRRYREIVRELIACTLENESPEAIDEELRLLLASLQ